MSASLLLWIGYHAIALPLALWAALSACIADAPRQRRLRHRALPIGLLPLALAATVLAAPLGRPELALAGLALPALTFAAMVSNRLALHQAGPWKRLLHLPITGWNAALFAVFTLRALQHLAGVDGGTAGAALIGGHATVQTWVGDPGALGLPIWLHLPLCVPFGAPRLFIHALGSVFAVPTAAAMLASLTLAMPGAYQRADGFRAPVEPPPPLSEEQALGVHVGWGAADMADAASLGPTALVFDVDLELAQDPARVRDARARVDAARADGRTVIVIARPPSRLRSHPVARIADLAEEMAKLHWLAAERLAPDVLFVFAGPFGALRDFRVEVGTVDEWLDACVRATDQVRQANPSVRTAVAIECEARHGRRLFAALRRGDAPVTAVGLIAHPESTPWNTTPDAFETFAAWLDEDGGDRPVWLLDVGACPASSGGELGQWHVVARALAFAAAHDMVAGVCISPLRGTPDAQRESIAPTGRPRRTFRELAERAAPRVGATPR